MKKQSVSAAAAGIFMLVVACAEDADISPQQGGGGRTSGEAGASPSAGDDAGGEGGAATAPRASCDPPPVAGPTNGEGGAGAGAAETLAIVGSFTDNWGSDHTISDSRWLIGSSTYNIARFDNVAQWVVVQNDEDNVFNPCLWSRFDWAEVEGTLYYCQSAYNAPTEAAAIATPAADPSNPATTGCSSFPWSRLVPQ